MYITRVRCIPKTRHILFPCASKWFILIRPFCNCIVITHTCITTTAYGYQIIESCCASLRFWYIVPALKIKDCNYIFAPSCLTLSLESLAHITQPELFLHRLRNCLFSFSYNWTYLHLK